MRSGRWKETRHGARAIRGFHFQDAVGALLAAKVATGSIESSVLVPEGFDDMSLEGSHPCHVQIKSRQPHLDPFTAGEASSHVLDTWEYHSEDATDGLSLLIVLEQGVKEEAGLSKWDRPLEASLSGDSEFRADLRLKAERRGMSDRDISRLFSSTVVVGATWEEVTSATVAEVETFVSLSPFQLLLVAGHLRSVVADASDMNASPDYEARCQLRKTDLAAQITEVAEQISVESVEFAIAEGICEPLNLAIPAIADDRFYEGTATQPGHVAAGLVVPRPDMLDEVKSGLDERSAVVVIGLSGIGKSAVLWTVPQTLPGVLWYRVRHLSPEDVPHLVRLARAYKVAPDRPVGFLIDAAGTDQFTGWSRLRIEAAAVPGMLLVATARTEDLFVLGDLTGCATVTLRLDETTAETIFKGLKRRGATEASYWLEAFNRSQGLTLEFTHLLTLGKRLGDVITGQVRRRIVEKRHIELDVLQLVSTADRWSASLATAKVMSDCAVSEWELREAIERLTEEHLIVERNGTMSGLHQLRSIAISDTIHAQPPPDINTTLRRVISIVPDGQLPRFIANLLRDVPSARPLIIESAAIENPELGRIAAYLQGLRLADFYEVATTWNNITDERKISACSRPLLFFHMLAGIPMADLMPKELRTAQETMAATPPRYSHRDLVARIGKGTLGRLLAMESRIESATQMLAAMEGGNPAFATAVEETLDSRSPLAQTLQSASMEQLGECLSAAHYCDPALAETLLVSIGGTEYILEQLRRDNPWITELDIRTKDDGPIAFGRILHVSDAVQGDARERCVALGQTLLRCLPHIESVDIQALAPGGHELRFGNFTHGISHLKGQFDYAESLKDWNQARMREVYMLLGDTDTNRLAAALPLLQAAADLTKERATIFLTGEPIHLNPAEYRRRVLELHNAGRELKPPLGQTALGRAGNPDIAPALITDHLSSLIVDLTGDVFKRIGNPEQHRKLAAYISDTVMKHLNGAINEPWSLLDIEGHPQSLDELRDTLLDIYAVLDQLARKDSATARVLNSVRSGRPEEALHRAAQTSRRHKRQRTRKRHRQIQRLCDRTGLTANVLHRPQDRPILEEFAITVELDSLLDWLSVVDTLHGILSDQQPVDEIYSLLPLRKGRPIPKLLMRLITQLHPSPELGHWDTMLPEPWPSRLADRFGKAEAALEVLSGIGHLSEDCVDHELVQTAAQDAVEQLHAAHQSLLELPTDPLVARLAELVEAIAAQVQEELDGTHTGQSYIEQLAVSVYKEQPTDELVLILHSTYLALEWDIDRENAIDLLLSDCAGG